MTLHMDMAYSETQFRKKHPESYCASFWMASEKVTERLGAVFAEALSFRTPDDMSAQPSIRIGLAGPSDSGKSTFIKGFMSSFSNVLTLEKSTQLSAKDPIEQTLSWFAPSYDDKSITQSLILSTEAGAILQRDALWNKLHEDSRLSNYDDVHRYGNVNLELIEHPYADRNKDYDIIIMIEKRRDLSLRAIFDKSRKFGAVERELTIYAGDEFRNNEKFRAFQASMNRYSTNIV